MIAYTYQRVTFNGKQGWFATRRIDGVYRGKQFGFTQRQAREAFDQEITLYQGRRERQGARA